MRCIKSFKEQIIFFLSVCWWSDFLSQRGTAKLEVFFQRANYFRFLFQKFTIIIIYIQYLFYFVFLITGLIWVCLFRLWIVEVIAMTFRFLCFRIYYLYKKQAQMYLLKIFCVLLVRLDLYICDSTAVCCGVGCVGDKRNIEWSGRKTLKSKCLKLIWVYDS